MYNYAINNNTQLIKNLSVTLRINYQRVLKFISVSFEILPPKRKKFENILKLYIDFSQSL